jgi:hypothetical protein
LKRFEGKKAKKKFPYFAILAIFYHFGHIFSIFYHFGYICCIFYYSSQIFLDFLLTMSKAQLKKLFSQFPPSDAAAIQKSVEAFNQVNVAQNLAYIQSHFAIIPDSITKLETKGMPLSESLNVLLMVKNALESAPGEIGQKVRDKLDYVLEKNPGITRLLEIASDQRRKNRREY